MPSSRTQIRFGTFQLDLQAGELHKNGTRIRLQQQPAHLLAVLLEQPGQIVTREELRQRLWSDHTFVDFEHGLNAAVKRLRNALGDSAENPVFIETLPRRGYRFIAPVESGEPEFQPASVAAPVPATRRPEAINRRNLVSPAIALVLLLLLVAGTLGYSRWKARRASSASAVRSLAVLPLQDVSADGPKEYFSDGMTEALITELGKIRELRVISHHSMMRYKNTAKPVPEIAKELNVDGVVEGSVLLSGQRVRITVQLIAANPEQHLWAESYERNMSDIISLEREVARNIAGHIQAAALPPGGPTELGSARPINIEAYNAYLQGRYLFARVSEENVAKAIAYYEQAVMIDPDYAPAWAALAEARDFKGGAYGPAEEYEKARAAAQRALALDPNLAMAHAAMGLIQRDYDWDWSGAEEHFQKALALEPGNATILLGAALVAGTLGRYDQALALNRRAVELNPLDASAWHFLANKEAGHAGQVDEAVAAFRKAVELNPQHPWSHSFLGEIYLRQSRLQEALAEFEKEPDPMFRTQERAILLYRLGRKKESDAALAELIAKWPGDAAYQIAEVYGERGEADQIFYWLDKAYAQRDAGLPYLKGDEAFNSVKHDPRYAAFLRKLRLPVN